MSIALGLTTQYLVIAVAVIASAAYLVHRQWPDAVRRIRLAVAVALLRAGRSELARRIAPTAPDAAPACGGCNGCGSPPR